MTPRPFTPAEIGVAAVARSLKFSDRTIAEVLAPRLGYLTDADVRQVMDSLPEPLSGAALEAALNEPIESNDEFIAA